MSRPSCFRPSFLALLPALLAFACASEPAADAAGPVPETRADSVALRLHDALGGTAAWAALPYLGFDFAVGQDTTRRTVARHFWDRYGGDYRLEWSPGEDSVYVALFNVDTREGGVYLNGAAVDTAQAGRLLERAYSRFINDTYWMMAPSKVFDPGVTRTYVPDSSDADTDVIQLSFADVGLTPGDRYWLYVDRETGRLERWAYLLQSNTSGVPGVYEWTDYESFETPAGPVTIATRKQAVGRDRAVFTDRIEAPRTPPDGIFTDPAPRLMVNAE